MKKVYFNQVNEKNPRRLFRTRKKRATAKIGKRERYIEGEEIVCPLI